MYAGPTSVWSTIIPLSSFCYKLVSLHLYPKFLHKLYFNIVVLLVVFDRITVFIAGCDGGRWAHSDGRGVWRRGRASDHAVRKHTVRRHQRSGWWRWLHKLAGARQQQSLEQQAAHRAGQQAREYGLTTLPVGDNMRNTLLNHQGGALSCSLSLSLTSLFTLDDVNPMSWC